MSAPTLSTESGEVWISVLAGQCSIAVAALEDGRGIGQVRLAPVAGFDRASLYGFIHTAVEPGSIVCTGWLNPRRQMKGCRHKRRVKGGAERAGKLLPEVHRVVSPLKRWMLGTH